jgi:glycerol-3-phosphate dehydrogenase
VSAPVVSPSSQSELRPDVAGLVANPRAQVLVIGGGINGIATFRDLALQGVDVILVERSDYCSGASAASSHMIHGGVRYLENGEFRLVRESVQERNRLLRLAPHYVKPLPTTIPIFSTFSGIVSAPLRFLTHKQGKPKERGALLIKLGLLGYDSFSRDGGSVPRHQFAGRDLVEDARATGAHARSANYVEAIGVEGDEVLLRDTVSGRQFSIAADAVVNTTGPWTDLTNQALGMPSTFMGGTKGSHIVLDNPALYEACAGGEVFFENNDGRIVLIYPLNGRVLVGTTDLEADITAPAVCTEEEVDYFFKLVSHVFPRIPVDRSQIVYRYSGIRPLPKHDDTAPGFVSRDYRIEPSRLGGSTKVPMLSLVGGKWTTFRALSEHLTNETLELLGASRKVGTEKLAIGGGVGFPTTPQAADAWVSSHASGLGAERARVLLARYGTKADRVIDAERQSSDDHELSSVAGFTTAEIAYLVENEFVVHLTDLVLRRTILAFVGDLDQAAFDELSSAVADALGWSAEQLASERAIAVRDLALFHGLELDAAATASAVSVAND